MALSSWRENFSSGVSFIRRRFSSNDLQADDERLGASGDAAAAADTTGLNFNLPRGQRQGRSRPSPSAPSSPSKSSSSSGGYGAFARSLFSAAGGGQRPAYNKDRCKTLLVIDEPHVDWSVSSCCQNNNNTVCLLAYNTVIYNYNTVIIIIITKYSGLRPKLHLFRFIVYLLYNKMYDNTTTKSTANPHVHLLIHSTINKNRQTAVIQEHKLRNDDTSAQKIEGLQQIQGILTCGDVLQVAVRLVVQHIHNKSM